MASERDLKKLLPSDDSALQIMYLDEIAGRLAELTEKMGKINAWETFKGPMTRMFPRDQQYQYATVAAGRNATVYYLRNPQPDLLVGIITQVANDWFANTYLDWHIDYLPKTVRYTIANIENPKEYDPGIPFHEEIKWVAYNDDVEEHTFGVLCDGFFIKKELFDKIVK